MQEHKKDCRVLKALNLLGTTETWKDLGCQVQSTDIEWCLPGRDPTKQEGYELYVPSLEVIVDHNQNNACFYVYYSLWDGLKIAGVLDEDNGKLYPLFEVKKTLYLLNFELRKTLRRIEAVNTNSCPRCTDIIKLAKQQGFVYDAENASKDKYVDEIRNMACHDFLKLCVQVGFHVGVVYSLTVTPSISPMYSGLMHNTVHGSLYERKVGHYAPTS